MKFIIIAKLHTLLSCLITYRSFKDDLSVANHVYRLSVYMMYFLFLSLTRESAGDTVH